MIFFVALLCILGTIYIFKRTREYENTDAKEKIIDYFRKRNATSLETALTLKDLSKNKVKTEFLTFMVKDRILILENGKYYLNQEKDA